MTAQGQGKTETPAVIKPVQQQLEGYNKRDIDTFASAFSDTVKVYRQPGVLTYQGRDELRKRYGAMFASTPDLHCEIVNRIVAGDVVIDHEKVQRKKGQPRTDAIAVYRIQDGLIVEVTFIPPQNQ
ncbi:nuclear transport factor 2 family protein [Pontibacter sp. HJ8]